MNPSGIDANESVTHRSSGPLRRIRLQHYGLAILSVGVALGTSLLLDHFHFRVPSALLLLFAVAISSWYAGAGPAVLAAILSTISFYWYFVEPVRTTYINRSEIPYFVIFTAFAALLSRFGTFRQRAEADLRRTHDQLKVERPKLGSRTIALLYFAFSSCWILFTDHLVHGLGLSNAYLLKVSEAKGILFISLSTLLMYVLVEKALRQRHSVATAYWQLVETAQEGVWSVDAEGKTVFANENMAAILGTSPGEMIGKSILPFVPQEKKDELLNHLLQREQGLQEHYEFPFLRADGAQVWTLLRVSPVLRDGQHSGCLALVSDITKRKQAEEALRRLNRELRAISNCNQALLRATDEQSLLEEICRIVCEEAGYRMAWVSYAEHDEAKSVRPVAWTGAEEGYLASAGITWADTDRGRSPTGTAIRSGKSCCIQDFAKDPRLAPWREGLLQRGFRSGIALPLKDENDNAFGSLTIHSAQPNAFTSEEVRLLEELAGDLAFGIVTLRSRAARKQAEQALRQSEAYLAEAQRLSHTGSWALDVASGNYVYSSEEYFRICGFDPQQGLPAKDQPLQQIHRDDFDKFWQAFQKLIDEKVDSEGEYRIVLADGTVKYVHAIRHPVLNANGELVEIVGTTVDITERKRAEEALRRSEAYLAEAQRLTHTGSFAYDGRTNTFPYWSEEHFRIWGFDPRQGPPDGETLLQRVHPEDREMVREQSVKALRERRDYTAEYRIVLPDGIVKHIEAIGHLVSTERGGPIEVIGTHVDVTARKRAEEALRRSEAYLAEAQRLTHTGSWALDVATDKYDYLSEEMFRIYPFDPQEGLPTREAVLRRIHPEDLDGVKAGFEKSLREKVDSYDEFRIVLPDGTVKHIYFIRHPVLNDAGDIVKLVGTAVDITERKRAEEALRRSEAYLSDAQKLTHTGAWATDAVPEPLYWSEELFRLYGLDPQDGFPTHDQALQRVHPEDRDKYVQAFHRVIHQKVDSDVEFRTVLPDGAIRYLYGLGHPVLNAHGELVEVVGTTVDITERKRAEEEMRESETRFRTFVDHAGDALFVQDLEQGTIVDVNRQACESLGYTRQELIGNTAVTFHLDADRAEMESAAERAAAGETVVDTHRHRRKDGTVFPVEANTSSFWYGGRRFLLHFSRDITDRLRAEEELRNTAAQWQATFDAVQDLVLLLDKDFRVLRANHAAAEFLGLPFDKIVGGHCYELTHGTPTHPAECPLAKMRQSRRHEEAEVLAREGGPWLSVSVDPVFDPSGEITQVVHVARDITERKRAEEALREGETRFRTFVDHAGDALFVYDLEQRIVVDVNREACESLGYTREELIGKSPLAFHLDSYQAEMESIADRAVAGETVIDRHWHRRRDGSLFPVEVHTSVISYGGRRFLLMVARDVTDRARAEEQHEKLRQLEADLAHIDRVSILGELTASIAHEVNQPLSGIVSSGSACLRWLARDVPDLEEAREAARRIVRDGKRAGEIIARIRALTKKAVASGEKLDLNETIREVLGLVGDEAKRKSVIIGTQFGDGVFPVRGDRVQLQQVLLNLVMNAIEAMSSVGDRARELVITTRNIDPDQVLVTVEDSGTGIDPQMIDKIFDSFYTTKPGGMGMGLSISRSILRAHGGRLWATAKDGAGTIFHFTLPKYHEEESNAAVPGV